MEDTKQFTYSMNLKLITNSPFFGPGVVELLQHILKTGSLNQAAKDMNMSYNKAWRIIKRAEDAIGYKLIIKNIGGSNGGGSTVTDEGKKLIDKFLLFQRKSYQAVDKYFADIFGEGL